MRLEACLICGRSRRGDAGFLQLVLRGLPDLGQRIVLDAERELEFEFERDDQHDGRVFDLYAARAHLSKRLSSAVVHQPAERGEWRQLWSDAAGDWKCAVESPVIGAGVVLRGGDSEPGVDERELFGDAGADEIGEWIGDDVVLGGVVVRDVIRAGGDDQREQHPAGHQRAIHCLGGG